MALPAALEALLAHIFNERLRRASHAHQHSLGELRRRYRTKINALESMRDLIGSPTIVIEELKWAQEVAVDFLDNQHLEELERLNQARRDVRNAVAAHFVSMAASQQSLPDPDTCEAAAGNGGEDRRADTAKAKAKL